MRIFQIILAVLLAGCSFDPHPLNGAQACESGTQACPPGYICQSGLCGLDQGTVGKPQGTDCSSGCGNGMSCVNGECQCNDSQATSCSYSGCIVLSSDANNCGACGLQCDSSKVCRSGKCECPSATPTACGFYCVALNSDTSNCGSCGHNCPASQLCVSGECRCANTGELLCSDECIDPKTDAFNCGACGVDCGSKFPNATAHCLGGTCVFDGCEKGYADCNRDGTVVGGDGCEVNIAADSLNCGACGKACADTQWCNSGNCQAKAGCQEACIADEQCLPNACLSTTNGRICLPTGCRVCFSKSQTCYSNAVTCAFSRCETPTTTNTTPNVPTTFLGRTTQVQGTVNVTTQSVTFRVWDSGQIDGDIISLYVNGTRILDQYTLSATKKSIPWYLDYGGYNYVVLYAHNEGSIPPNTAALSLDDGSTEQDLVISADLSTCGAYNVVVGP